MSQPKPSEEIYQNRNKEIFAHKENKIRKTVVREIQIVPMG